MTNAAVIENLIAADPWARTWVQPGMFVVNDGKRAFEVKDAFPNVVKAVGCGGWDAAGNLHWVGLDLDVGHGKNAYETTEDAIQAALIVRNFVHNAAEIRLSKSGRGVHIRVVIGGNVTDGRRTAANIAKWLANSLEIKTDTAVLGRQNLWFWAAEKGASGFAEIEPAIGEWIPPAAALKEPPVLPTPIMVQPSNRNDAEKRAAAYLNKVPGAVAGQAGHDKTFYAACLVVRDFDLTIDQARPLLQQWNTTCTPPWSERELEHKLREAAKIPGPRGTKLIENRPRTVTTNEKYSNPETEIELPDEPPPEWKIVPNADAQPSKPAEKPSDLVIRQLADEKSGKRFSANWPFQTLTRLANALLPGTATILCAPAGSSKTFFLLQCLAYWLEQGYSTAVLTLEEDRTWHLRRALSQKVEDSNICSDTEWVKTHPDEADAYAAANRDYLDTLGGCIYEAPNGMNTQDVLTWLSRMADAGHRIIAIDPITARDEGEFSKPWIDDKKFVRGADRIMKSCGASLVLLTHPPKNPTDTSLDNIAGGAAYQRFSQTVFWMKAYDAESLSVKQAHGTTPVMVNRKIHLRKTRNGKSENTALAYWFDSKSLKFVELGIAPTD